MGSNPLDNLAGGAIGALTGAVSPLGQVGTLLGGVTGGISGTAGLPQFGNPMGNMSAAGAPIMTPTSAEQAQQQYDAVRNAQAQQQAFAQAAGGMGGLQNQQQAFQMAQQQALGQGPNPAQAMLNQATGANVANQAALMAGQRGGASNVGLMARQAANQGANIQQQAAGQAATMGAQQQLAGQQQMANIANQQVQQQQQAAAQQGQLALGGQQNVLQGIQGQNAAISNIAGSQNQLIGQKYGSNMGMLGGLLGGVGTVFGMANGGEVPSHSGPQSMLGRSFLNMQSGGSVPGEAKVAGDSPKNDTVPAMLSAGEIVIPRSIAQHPNAPDKAAKFVAALMAKKGK